MIVSKSRGGVGLRPGSLFVMWVGLWWEMQHELDWFYKSFQWKQCREAYLRKVGGLCEECLKLGLIEPAEMVHHIVHLSPANVDDDTISLSFDNLEALCKKHHAQMHPEIYKGRAKRWMVSDSGKVLVTDSPHGAP